jgi:hypothetical protein
MPNRGIGQIEARGMMATRRVGLECCQCRCLFGGEGAFKKHRTGSYGIGITSSNGITKYTKHSRRCLSESEMISKNMVKNDRGIWTTGEFDASVFNKKEGAQ